MMPEGRDEDVVELIEDAPTPGKGWANYHAQQRSGFQLGLGPDG